MTLRDLSRRTVLAGACGSCAVAVAGCSTYITGHAAPSELPTVPTVGAAAPGTATDDAKGTGTLAATADIPVGSGKVITDADVVISQPTAGKFVAFSATCTHQGCSVSTITGNTVNCPCHGSSFALADGSVVKGPATNPLPEKDIRVSGGQIRLA
jgi:Rieske Fe-S protein